MQFAADDPFGLHLLPPEQVTRIAAAGTEGTPQALPHRDRIQASFGRHDVSGVRAHVGGNAADAATQIGARAYATGNDVAFADSPDVHTAAHEAAHVVQQRGGVQLYGGVGTIGDRYEQHADSVADAVVRGDSAEGLLDEMSGAGEGRTASAVQRQESGSPGAAAGGSKNDLAGAAEDLSFAVEVAQLKLHRSRGQFIDSELVGVQMAAKALADALHTHGGKLPKADAKVVDRAMSAAFALADELTIGPLARPKFGAELRAVLAQPHHERNDPRNDEPAKKPEDLIPVAAESLAKLRVARTHVSERILDYASADLHSLDEAIHETTDWVADLSGPDGVKAASRLSRAVMDQAEVLDKIVPQLEGFLAQPLTESSDEVVYALVIALAHSTKRADKARRTADLAIRTRKRQRFDAPRTVIDEGDAQVAELGQFDKKEGRRARQEQDRLERRVDQLEKRVMAGGKVSSIERDELLVEAREHKYNTHVRVLQLELRDTANGLDELDDGFTGGVNRYSDEIPNLVSDLRGMSRVAGAAIGGYQERVRLIEAAANEIDDEGERRKRVAVEKLAALDWLESFLQVHLENARLEKRLKDAAATAKKAQTRLFIANLLTTIAMTLAGNLAASAVRGAAEGVVLARAGAVGMDALEAAQTAKAVGTVAYAATDLTLNSAGQKLALGDKRSFVDIMGANALSALATTAISMHFVKIEHMIDEVSATASGWQRAAMHAKKFAVNLPQLSMEMIVGAAVDHAYTVARGYETPPDDPNGMVSQWMAQGAAMAIGRHIAAHSKAFRELSGRLQRGARDHSHAFVLAMDVEVRAAGVMRTGDIAHAQAVLAEFDTLMAVEQAMIAKELEESHPNRRLADDTLEEATPGRGHAQDEGAEEERLPRTKQDRDPFSAEGIRENAAAIAAGEPGYNSVVGHVADEAAGVATMQRLLRGDVAALTEIGYTNKGKFDPSSREWGLGKIGKKYVIVAGEHAAVDWSALKGVEPVGHSHIIDEGRIRLHRGQRLDIRKMIANATSNPTDAALVFSSPADIQFAALRRLAEHAIALPYEHLEGTEITLASQQSGRPQLLLVLQDATYHGISPVDGAMRYHTRATLRAGENVVWEGTIDAVFPGGKRAHLEFDVPSRPAEGAEVAYAATKTRSETIDEPPPNTGTDDHRPKAVGRVEEFLGTLSQPMAERFRASGHAQALDAAPYVLEFVTRSGEKNVSAMERFVTKTGLPAAQALPLLDRLLRIRTDLSAEQVRAFADALRGGPVRAAPLNGADEVSVAIELAGTKPYADKPEKAPSDLRALLADNVTLPVAFNELLSPSPSGAFETLKVAGPGHRGPDVRMSTADGTTVGREMYATDMETELSATVSEARDALEVGLMRGVRGKAFDYQRPDVPRFTHTEVSVHVRESSKGYNFDQLLEPALFERVMHRMRINPDTRRRRAADVLDRVRFYNSRGDLVYEWHRPDAHPGATEPGGDL